MPLSTTSTLALELYRRCRQALDDFDSEFQSILKALGKNDRDVLEAELDNQIKIEKEDIELQILRDKEHLALVNFCVDKFSPGSRLNSKTGYVWIRVDPLYGSGEKTFDIAIYNRDSKTLILVECKSSLRQARKELDELLEKIGTTPKNKSALDKMVGDDVNIIEHVLCLKAGDLPIAKSIFEANNIPCCLWAVDIFSDKLLLEKLGANSLEEIKGARLHHDDDLRRILLGGGYEKSSLKAITFLPSSHMSTILEDLVPRLKLELDRTQSEEFGFGDMRNLMSREPSLQNFEDEERLELAEKALTSALECEIVVDKTGRVENLREKRFRLVNQMRSHRRLIEDCHKKYVDHHARDHALERVLKRYRDEHPGLTNFYKS